MPGVCWELNRDIKLASEAVCNFAQKTTDWMKLAEAINKLFSTEEKSMQLKGRQGCREK